MRDAGAGGGVTAATTCPTFAALRPVSGAGFDGLTHGHFSKPAARSEFPKNLAVGLDDQSISENFRPLPRQQCRNYSFGRIEPAPKKIVDPPVAIQKRAEMRDSQAFQLLTPLCGRGGKRSCVLGGYADDLHDIGLADGGSEHHRILHRVEKIEPIIISGCNRAARLYSE